MPARVWEILDSYDHAFSPELKRDLGIEACIVMRKKLRHRTPRHSPLAQV
jgi:hypothetical protein